MVKFSKHNYDTFFCELKLKLIIIYLICELSDCNHIIEVE